jgi:hypothetical protein
VRNQSRQPHLEALEAPDPPSDAAGRESTFDAVGRKTGDKTVSLLKTIAVVDNDRRFTEVEDHHDGRMRDQLNFHELSSWIAESDHPDPRQPAGPVTGPRCPTEPWRRELARRVAGSHATSQTHWRSTEGTFA